MTCESHSNFASTLVKEPTSDDDDADKSFVLEFSNCTVNDGQGFKALMGAMNEWSEYQQEHGFANSTYMMFPVFGESNGDYAFKMVHGRDDFSAFGADYEFMGNGGHWVQKGELPNEVIECDIPRVYNGMAVREWAEDED